MKTESVPHYLRFARAMALVAIAAPVPAVAVLGACGNDASTNGDAGSTATGSPIAETTDSGTYVVSGSTTSGTLSVDGGAGAYSDASDAQSDAPIDGSDDDAGGGGPHRGTPELPASFRA